MARDDDGAGFGDLFEDLDAFFREEPEERRGREEPEPAANEPPPIEQERRSEPAPAVPPAGERTAEMPPSDWRRLQEVLGDEEEAAELEVTASPSPDYDDEVDEGGDALRELGKTHAAGTVRRRFPSLRRRRSQTEDAPEPEATASSREEPSLDLTDQAAAAPTPLWEERVIDEIGAAADRVSDEFADVSVVADDVISIEPSAPVPVAASPEGSGPRVVGPTGPIEETEQPQPQSTPATRPPMPSSEPSEPPSASVQPGRTRRTVRVTEGEAISEPSFAPAGTRPAGAPSRPGPRGDRNLGAAIVSGVLLAAIGLILLAWHPAWFAVLVIAIVLFAQFELYRAMQRRGYQPATLLGLVMGALITAGAYWQGEAAMALVLAATALGSFLWFLFVPSRLRDRAVANIGLTVLGVAYVPFLAAYVLVILSQANQGRALLLSVIGLTFLYDVAAFVVGSNVGRHPLAASVSPKKTWEGLVGATVVTLVAAVAVVAPILGVFSLTRALALWAVVAVFAPLGDLAESSIKRDLGVKDMGTTMPGHGGALDRIDSLLFVAPAAFYLFRLFF